MQSNENFKSLLKDITDGTTLNYQQSKLAFETIMSGEATDAQISSFLTAIKMQEHNPVMIAAGAEIQPQIKIGKNCSIGIGVNIVENIKSNTSFIEFQRHTKIQKKK